MGTRTNPTRGTCQEREKVCKGSDEVLVNGLKLRSAEPDCLLKDDRDDPDDEDEVQAEVYALSTIEEAPQYLKMSNILTGYRVRFPYRMCLESLFRVHNQTGNVWTHLVASLWFVSILRDTLEGLPEEIELGDRVALSAVMIGLAVAFMGSASFHLFNSHSCKGYASWNMIDCLGIVVAISGIGISYIYYGFYCEPFFRFGYLIFLGTLSLTVAAMVMAPKYRKPENKLTRTLFFVAFVVAILAFILHAILLTCVIEGNQHYIRFFGIMSVASLIALLGSYFYVSGVPEKWFPGHFDFWLNSHQLWHGTVIVAGVLLFRGLTEFLQWRAYEPCAA